MHLIHHMGACPAEWQVVPADGVPVDLPFFDWKLDQRLHKLRAYVQLSQYHPCTQGTSLLKAWTR